MRYKGKPLVQKNSTTVSFRKGDEVIEFIVSPLPMGWWQKMQAIGVSIYPEPKKIALTDSKGTVVRSKDTGKAEVTELTDDPEYKKSVALTSRRIGVLRLACLLRDDPNIEWESQEPSGLNVSDWQAYADSLLDELKGSSLTDDEIAEILNEGESSACVLDVGKVADQELLTPTMD